jgi:hypothetical protein
MSNAYKKVEKEEKTKRVELWGFGQEEERILAF